MKVSRTRLAAIIADRTLSTTISERDLSQEIAAYLLSEGRTGELDSLLRDVMQVRAENGIVEVSAISSHEISAVVRADIEAIVRELQPHASSVIISEVLDPSVIGGVKLEFANEQLDLSVRAKLNHFKQLTAATGGL
jgi:F-type H+-transporting ATPase subunit delta